MSTMAITWVRMKAGVAFDGTPDHFIDEIIEREAVTTSGTANRSTAAPAGADCAIVSAVDADLIVTSGGASVDASDTLGVDVATGEKAYIRVSAGNTYISGIER
jgi:hypothetical protein